MFFYGWRGIFLDIENRVEHQNKIKRPAGTGRFVLCLAFTGLSQTPIIIITTVLFYSLLSIILLYLRFDLNQRLFLVKSKLNTKSKTEHPLFTGRFFLFVVNSIF